MQTINLLVFNLNTDIKLLLFIGSSSANIYCTCHDVCRNKVWNGEYNIYCGTSNSERTCHSTTLTCDENNDCSIKILFE